MAMCHAQQDIRARARHLTSVAEEALSMIALAKAFARGHHERRRFAEATGEAAVARLGSVRVQAVFPPPLTYSPPSAPHWSSTWAPGR